MSVNAKEYILRGSECAGVAADDGHPPRAQEDNVPSSTCRALIRKYIQQGADTPAP